MLISTMLHYSALINRIRIKRRVDTAFAHVVDVDWHNAIPTAGNGR